MQALMPGLLVASIVLGGLVHFDPGPWFLDAAILEGLAAVRTPGTNDVIRVLTGLGGHYVMIPASIVVCLALARKHQRTSAFLALALLCSALVNELLKVIVQRARPEIVEAVTHPRGLSFPSGHSQASMAIAAGVAVALWRIDPKNFPRALLLLFFPLFIGTTRAYLGVHYPTDVLAGWCLGAFVVLLVHRLLPPKASTAE